MPALRSARPRLAAVAGTALAVLLLAAPSASAHVSVGADDPRRGAGDTVITFRVPNENPASTTTKVAISFPTRNPIASVKPAVKPGWTFTTTTARFATPIATDDGEITSGVTQVVYTAKSPAEGTPAGGFDAFSVLAGPLPSAVGSLAFPTVQTYADGHTTAWADPVIAGGAEPEHPAPVLTLTAATTPAPAPSATAVPAPSDPQTTGSEATAPTAADVDTARALGIAGLVAGLLGLFGGGAALVAARRRPTSTS